jgi:hypothetical protein
LQDGQHGHTPPEVERIRLARMRICLIAAGLFAALPALALDEPVPWRDPESGCKQPPNVGVKERGRTL